MFLKKVDGPRAVTLPDGQVFTQADLPKANTKRWVASRKLAVVRGVLYGLISQSDAVQQYGLSDEEFCEWVSSFEQFGKTGLKATMHKTVQKKLDNHR
ncbi:DUF1153 domain-containing protein [Roseovarius sp. EL26]|uniref:CtrA inhibitor SciP n=1 Tax=Roseovarius sp. EL26 TaxID=2126672 RepID=UPI000EA1B68F|nr:DUF1153 domain-containing protein [Roseovarius sp. EL26]